MKVLEYQVFVFIATWMGSAITKIVAWIPTAKPEGIARDTERDSQKSGRAGVRKKFTSWWGRRWSQECVWTWPLVMGYGRLCRHQHFIYIHEVQVPIGILILSSGRYGSTGRDPFSNEYHLRVHSDLRRSKILWHCWSRTCFRIAPFLRMTSQGEEKCIIQGYLSPGE